ncbi:MATE efflux family protein [Striga asiatica]|uniref:MATE efflux family protein n=1 Tax=Striga asiatica TaxID=4170 RepID=A0A5A7PUJ0_STRAF|nr:MATE efflux family protein [Striga asiatica]
MENASKRPLLAPAEEEQAEPELSVQDYLVYRWSTHSFVTSHSFITSFVDDGDDIPPISSARQFSKAFARESKKLWYLAGPAIFTSLCQYSLGAITQTFAGHVGTLDLAAFSIENSVIAGLSFGIMLGMGSALETLCGQAYGAGQVEMLGIYMQRSWVILLCTAFILMFLYIFALPFLLLIGQTEDISRAAGKIALWMIPQLFAYAVNFPIAKFLQAQSKIMAMAWISAVALHKHSRVDSDGSHWIQCSNQVTNVRVSNELGADHPRTAKFSVLVVVVSSFVIGLLIAGFLLIFHNQYPSWFSNSLEVKQIVYQLTPLLVFCIVVNNVQPALSGVAIGAGWQALVAYVNIACYYLFGIPLGLILGYALNMDVKGIWYGMVAGTLVQTLFLFLIVYKTNWQKEASVAALRIKMWGGEADAKANDVEK